MRLTETSTVKECHAANFTFSAYLLYGKPLAGIILSALGIASSQAAIYNIDPTHTNVRFCH